jgi:cell division septum initiation protein DivIVA
MMTPYVDSELGLRDPDEFGNFTPQEFVTYARGLVAEMRRKLQAGEISEAELQAAIDRLSEQFRRLLSAPRRAEDDITVPTGSLYVEALPGAHPILEDFKLKHRAVDIKKVQAEVRRIELENLRYAARILEGEREDPDVERKIVVEGTGPSIVLPPTDV